MAKRRTLDEKLSAVARLEAGESGRAVAADIGVSFGQVHRWHRAWLVRGAAGLRRGALHAALTAAGEARAASDRAAEHAAVRASLPGAEAPAGACRTVSAEGAGASAEQIAALERKVAQQALELDFFATALQRVEGSSQAPERPGARASTPPSGRRRRGKAD